MGNALGCDVSVWQDANSTPQKINFASMKTNGASFVIIRSSYGITQDEDFDYNWREAQKAGLIVGVYHFYDYLISPTTQAAFFVALLRKYGAGNIFPAIDMEEKPGYAFPPREPYLGAVKTFADSVERNIGCQMMYYSNPNIMKYKLAPIPSWMTDRPLWIAHYTQAEQPMFSPWESWLFWQFSCKGPGAAFGAESISIDMNYFNGSEDDLRMLVGWDTAEPPVIPDAEKVQKLWAAHPELW